MRIYRQTQKTNNKRDLKSKTHNTFSGMVFHANTISSTMALFAYSPNSISIQQAYGASYNLPLAVKTKKIITAHDWVNSHRNALEHYKGQFVAVDHNGIIAASYDFDEVSNKAKSKSIRPPFVFKVPDSDKPKVVSAKQV
jgi:hypothetical protein